MALPRLTRNIAKRAAVVARHLVCVAMVAGPAAAQVPSVGSTIANPAVLGRMFSNVCISATQASQVEAALRGVGMIGNPETGTFFHQLFDMSINPTGGGCSMVFVIEGPEEAASAAFENAVTIAQGTPVHAMVISARESDGDIFMRARIEVSW